MKAVVLETERGFPTVKHHQLLSGRAIFLMMMSLSGVLQINTLPQRTRGCSMPVSFLQEKMEELHLYKDKSREPDWLQLTALHMDKTSRHHHVSDKEVSDWCWTDEIYWPFTFRMPAMINGLLRVFKYGCAMFLILFLSAFISLKYCLGFKHQISYFNLWTRHFVSRTGTLVVWC